MEQRRVAILGAGTIGESLLRGLISGGWRKPDEIVVTVRDEDRAAELSERHGVRATLSNTEAVSGAELVVIAVKPQDFNTLLGEIGSVLTPEQTVLSVAAAIPTSSIESKIAPGVPVVRSMPNRPATVHEGMAGICAGAHAGEEHLGWPGRRSATSGPSFRYRSATWTRSRQSRARGLRTSPCSPRR